MSCPDCRGLPRAPISASNERPGRCHGLDLRVSYRIGVTSHDEHRTPCLMQDAPRHASQQQSCEPRSAVRTHDDEVGIPLRGEVDDGRPGRSRPNLRMCHETSRSQDRGRLRRAQVGRLPNGPPGRAERRASPAWSRSPCGWPAIRSASTARGGATPIGPRRTGQAGSGRMSRTRRRRHR